MTGAVRRTKMFSADPYWQGVIDTIGWTAAIIVMLLCALFIAMMKWEERHDSKLWKSNCEPDEPMSGEYDYDDEEEGDDNAAAVELMEDFLMPVRQEKPRKQEDEDEQS